MSYNHEADLEYFKRNQTEFVKKYNGLELVIKDCNLINAFDSLGDAYDYGCRFLGAGNFTIQHCIPGEEAYTINSPYIESAANAQAYFQSYRGLCNLRVKYANFMSEGFEQMHLNDVITPEWVQKKIAFWAKVRDYWKNKFEESKQKEDQYFHIG